MQPLCKPLFSITVILFIAFCFSCTKNAPVKETTDFSLLMNYDWINVARPDTQTHAEVVDPDHYYLNTVVINDTSFLSFYNDSTFLLKRTATEHWHPGNHLYYLGPGVPPPGDYLPHGGSYFPGKFSFNPSDSILTETVILLGITFPDYDYKLLELSENNLTLRDLSYPDQSDTANAITHYVSLRR